MEARKKAEMEFHDKIRTVTDDTGVAETRWSPKLEATISDNPMWANMKYYAVERRSREMVLAWFRTHCKGKRVLDYCCGNGEDGIYIAKHGAAQVIGIDISETSIQNCTQFARREGVDRVASYQVADAENTGFPDDSFDVITEYGALHHLDLDKAFTEITRILKPDGKVICNEALAHNILIHTYRRLTPKLRTEWEVDHIMRARDFAVPAKYFGRIEMHFFHLFTLFAVPFRKVPFVFNPLLRVLEAIDAVLLKLPWLRWQAWQVVFVLSEPKKG
jgi:ubiquinone/menaquinone biosynthesis C-methylase UbiE